MSRIYHGVVTMYNAEKGYGFIKADDDTNHFVHCSEFVDKGNGTLAVGDLVQFAVGPSNNGKMQAVDVRIVE